MAYLQVALAADPVWLTVSAVAASDAGGEDWARPEDFHPTGGGGGCGVGFPAESMPSLLSKSPEHLEQDSHRL